MEPLRFFLHWVTVASTPFALCEDLRRHVTLLYDDDAVRCRCQRCGVCIETRRRVCMCLLRDERLCFTCYHRARWPMPTLRHT